MFFCQWGDCDFLHHLDGRRCKGDHLDTCLTRPVLDLCTCGHFVLKVSGWNRVACLKIDGLEWHYISFILFARYLQLSIRIHENDSSPVYTWQLLEAGLCTQGHRNLSDRHHHCNNFQLYQICSIYDHVCKCEAKSKFNTISLWVELSKVTQKEKRI